MKFSQAELEKLNKMRVFHLEDRPEYYTQLVKDFKTLGYEKNIHHFSGLYQLRNAMDEKVRIDLIFCDNHLPDGRGLEMISPMRELPRYKNTRIIMCTTVDEVESIISSINDGANDYIIKPWGVKELYMKVCAEISKI